MSEHFRAFSFVDRILSFRDGTRIEGQYQIPAGLVDFRASLAAESVGQLAAWLAMKEANFQRRPVAGIAGRVDLGTAPIPGRVLNLEVELQSLDEEAVAYGGTATMDGDLVVRLEDCVGPMILVSDLDDPRALSKRFDALCNQGAGPEGVSSLPKLVFERTEGVPGQYARAVFQVPASAPLFADHFPRRPVFPGSLLMQVCLELAGTLVEQLPTISPARWKAQSVMDMKLREFIPPGKSLELEARLKQANPDSATVSVSVRSENETISSARLLLTTEARV